MPDNLQDPSVTLPASPAPHDRKQAAFTLVELLVVIGIIAVLVSILLPTLGAARRQAASIKCQAALREIGNCFLMYSMENKQYAPPAKTNSNYRISFNSVPPVDQNVIQYWPSFLAKYVTRKKLGHAANASVADAAGSRSNNIFWGCTAFDGYASTAYQGNVNLLQTGYGMNAFPAYTPTFPPVADPGNVIQTVVPLAIAVVASPDNWRTLNAGTWYKLKAWTRPAERALLADSRFWLIEAQAAPLSKVIPGQGTFSNATTWSASDGGNGGQTTFDFYRHGSYPKKIENDRFSPNGGKISYNVLFADGHVANLVLREEAYRIARMRFPG